VKSYPTVLVLKQDGTEIDRIVGYYRAPEFIALAEDYLAGRNTLASMVQEEATKGSDAAFASKLADRYFEHGLYEDAKSRYERVATLDRENKTGLVVDKYPDSDMARTARLYVAGSYKREGNFTRARDLFLDYAKQFPEDEDAPYAKEQADSMAAKIAQEKAGKTGV
jgi:tetratricopeptide (TPR) repeat protein